MRAQFGRLCKLEFTNFVTQKKFTITEDLRISFEFLKTADELNESSKGVITIHGLTQETATKLGDRIGNLFQTEVKCSVGYAGDFSNYQTLFIGAVMSNKFRPSGGSSTTVIEVSANFADFHLGDMVSTQLIDTTIREIVLNGMTVFGVDGVIALPPSVPEDEIPLLAEAINNMKVLNWSMTGKLSDYVAKVCNQFGFILSTDKTDDGVKTYRFTLKENMVQFYAKQGQAVLAGNNSGYDVTKMSGDQSVRTQKISDLYRQSGDNTGTILNYRTGLLELPYLDNRNVKVPYDAKSAANEVVVEQKGIVAKRKKDGTIKTDENGNVLYKKPPKTKTVNRRFLSAKALINPSIKPNSIVIIDTGYTNIDGEYRVRNCRFRGDTHEGGWEVEMELEDTGDNRAATPQSTLPSESETDLTSPVGNAEDIGE